MSNMSSVSRVIQTKLTEDSEHNSVILVNKSSCENDRIVKNAELSPRAFHNLRT